MIVPEADQFVSIHFSNGTSVEGLVKEWNDDQIVLSSPESNNLLLIMKTEDIMLCKIVPSYTSPKEAPKKLEELKEQFQEELQKPSADKLRNKNLAQLKSLMNEQEKIIIASKLREHTITQSGVQEVHYGSPFIKK